MATSFKGIRAELEEDGYKKGYEKGRNEGRNEGKKDLICHLLSSHTIEETAKRLEMTTEEVYDIINNKPVNLISDILWAFLSKIKDAYTIIFI